MKTAQTKIFILPGLGDSGDGHWQTYFEKKLPNCFRIRQVDWNNPKLDLWVEKIDSMIGDENLNEIVCVAHSLGVIALVHWANRTKKKIKGAMLVAPPCNLRENTPTDLTSFLPIPSEILPFPTLLVGSTNEPWASVEQLQSLSSEWGSKFVLLNEAGHINTTSGHGDWDEGLKLFENFIS